jgi:hypothetical protein
LRSGRESRLSPARQYLSLGWPAGMAEGHSRQ